MAIAFGNVTKLCEAAELQNLTVAHTTSGSARGLMVWIFANNSGDAVTGVTYAGTSMTQVAKRARADYAPQICYLYWLANPASGSNNVIISTSTSITNSTAYAVSYTGVYQGAVENSGTNAVSSSGTMTASATTIDNNAWLIGGTAGFNSDNSINASTNTTSRGKNLTVNVGDSNAVSLTPGSNALTWTGISQQWVCIIASIAPGSGGGGSAGNFLPLLGVGI